jgi:4'-phosphopantetheinyl transferase
MFRASGLTTFDEALPINEVHVWHADLRVEPTCLTSLFKLLSTDEQERASRFKALGARQQFVISHGFLRLALGRYLQVEPNEVQFSITANGKPELRGETVRFNFSHTDGAAALALTRNRPVGIDVEKVRHDVDAVGVADQFFSSAEAEWLRSQPESERIASFYACWTAKEAFIKACGRGLSTPLAAFTVIPDKGDEGIKVQSDWWMWQLNLGANLSAALVVQARDVTIRKQQWPWPHESC